MKKSRRYKIRSECYINTDPCNGNTEQIRANTGKRFADDVRW